MKGDILYSKEIKAPDSTRRTGYREWGRIIGKRCPLGRKLLEKVGEEIRPGITREGGETTGVGYLGTGGSWGGENLCLTQHQDRRF